MSCILYKSILLCVKCCTNHLCVMMFPLFCSSVSLFFLFLSCDTCVPWQRRSRLFVFHLFRIRHLFSSSSYYRDVSFYTFTQYYHYFIRHVSFSFFIYAFYTVKIIYTQKKRKNKKTRLNWKVACYVFIANKATSIQE